MRLMPREEELAGAAAGFARAVDADVVAACDERDAMQQRLWAR
jgi:hypothetical protein